MPSANKAQATLMAMAAHNPAFAKKKGIPQRVARDYNRADKRSGILRKAHGGPLQAGMEAHMNLGQGRGNSMFSTMPLMGHAMSGTQLGQADALIRKSQQRFADGGAVKKDAKPQMSAKERREVRSMIERGKNDAVAALRDTRARLMEGTPAPEDADVKLSKLSQKLKTKANGENPEELYRQYRELSAALEEPGRLSPTVQIEMVDRLAQLSSSLEGLGLPIE